MPDWDNWVCPCPACNGYAEPDYAVDYEEPEHPENVSPERQGYEGE